MTNFLNLKFHHVGIAVKDFKKSLEFYKLLKYKWFKSKIFRDKKQKVDLILLKHDNFSNIELVKPYDDSSPILNYIKDNDNRIYHFCYEVDNFKKVEEKLKKKFRIINVVKPTPAILFNNRLVSFYYIQKVGLIEFLKK
jgi:catechol 2,3-dioxygenase-like lactoylglutathione lyase family enzyme